MRCQRCNRGDVPAGVAFCDPCREALRGTGRRCGRCGTTTRVARDEKLCDRCAQIDLIPPAQPGLFGVA